MKKKIKKCKTCGIAGNKWFYKTKSNVCKECMKREQKEKTPVFKNTFDFSQPIVLELSRAQELREMYL